MKSISRRLSVAAVLVACVHFLPASICAQQHAGREPSGAGASCTIIPGAKLVDLAPGSSLAHALRGKVAGLNVQTSNGMVGTGSRFVSRGHSSFGGAAEPLIFLDGTRLTPMSRTAGDHLALQFLDMIDPADVARVEVLRGPAATALYGTDASGGVIHIFTNTGFRKFAPLGDPKSSCP